MQQERVRIEGWLPLPAPVYAGSGDDGRLNADDGGYHLRLPGSDGSSVLRLSVGYPNNHADRDIVDDVLDEQSHGSDQDDTDTPPHEEQLTITVAAQPVQTTVTRRGAVWSATIPLPPGTTGMPYDQERLQVRLAGWNIEPSGVSLEPLTDLTPWFRGMDERVDRELREKPRPPVPEGSPLGREAERALIAQTTRERLSGQQMMLDRAARRRARDNERLGLWPAATEAVQNATGLDEYDAAARVARIVNQLADLFDTERELFPESVRRIAVEESLDYLLTGTAPTTNAVQERAEAAWALNDEMSALMRRRLQADEDARQAWRDWAANPPT